MAVTFADLTVDPQTLVDADPTSPVRIIVRTNTGGAIIDSAANKIFLGTYSVDTETTATISLPVTNGATNPTNFQYAVDLEYVDAATRTRKTWSSGWFSFTAAANLASIAAEQYVPPTWMTTATATLQGYVDQGKAYRDDQALIAGLTGEDTAVAALIDQAGPTPAESAVHAALSASFEHKVPRGGATTGQVPTLQADGSLAFSSVTIDASGNIATPGTVDGRDVSVDGTKLDGIAAGLSGLTDATTARTNLGLGTAATKNTGTGAGQVPVLSGTPGTPDGTKFLRDDGTWAAASGGGGSALLATATQNATTATSLSTASTSTVDMDATNLVVNFTAPSSGSVVVVLSAVASQSASRQLWSLRSGTTDIAGTERNAVNSTAETRVTVRIIRTGLTPGSSYSYKWAWRAIAGTATMYYGGSSGEFTPGTTNHGPATMEVWSA